MSAIVQASPLEKLSQEPLPTGDSCVLIIFGASGDLTKRKLIPGLYNLACEGCMNPQFEVLGIGRTPMSSEELRKKNGEAAAKSKDTRDFSESGWEDFETRLHYMVGDINDPNFYPQLRIRLEEMEKNGSQVARIGSAFGMQLIAWSQNMTPEAAKAAGAILVSKDQLFERADILTI